MPNKKFTVRILQTQATEEQINQLANLFKASTDKAKSILSKESFVIKKETDKATAEKFHKAISSIGVNCCVDELTEEDDIALPTIEEIENHAEVKPLTDITRPDITPLHEEKVNLSLAAGPVTKTVEKEEVIEDVNPENFCPECGTIRASANSICLHCGYDPDELKQSNTKANLTKGVIFVSILAVIAFVCWPYYQQYVKQSQIENDLKLAFDTRNKVTEFIKKTNFWPNQNIDAGLDKHISNASVESVTVGENAIITVMLRAQVLDGEAQSLILTPNILKGRIVWNCLKGTLAEKYRPEICLAHTPVTDD